MTVAIPGLTTRPYRGGDAVALAALLTRGDVADGVPWRASPEELEVWLSHPSERFQPERDLRLVEVGDELIGFWQVDWVDTTDDLREYRLDGMVDPAWRRRGIGTWLLHEAEAHARRLAAADPTERPLVLGAWQPDSRRGAHVLMEREGYAPVRFFFDMVRPTLDEISVPAMPDGLEVRPVPDGQLRRLWDADIEAFRDHWGGFDESEGRFERWRRDPKFDSSLHVVAWDGDEIAGGVINEISETENKAFNRKRGWLAAAASAARSWPAHWSSSAIAA